MSALRELAGRSSTARRYAIVIAIAGALTVALCALSARDAAACSCVNFGAAATFARAKWVFFGRAGKAATKGRWRSRPIAVLHALKGRPGKVLVQRSPANIFGGCRRSYRAGETSLVFADGPDISTCAGNYLLSVQMQPMAKYLTLAGGSAQQVGDAAVAFALERARAKLGLGKPGVTLRLRYKPWVGHRLARGTLRARVIKAPAWRHVDLTRLIAHGPVTLVSGVVVASMHFFDALVLRASGRFELLALRELRGCAKRQGCLEDGRCTSRDGRCIVARRRDCLSSRGCTSYARCTPRAGRCVIGGARDCKRAAGCSQYGLCAVRRGKCVAHSAAHCRRSTMCREFAECTLDRKTGGCIIGSQADCTQSAVACKANGRCRYDKKRGNCVR